MRFSHSREARNLCAVNSNNLAESEAIDSSLQSDYAMGGCALGAMTGFDSDG